VSGRVVLLVEDNEQNMELASFVLEEAGYQVMAARTVVAARAELASRRPDIILLDMNLAGEDGRTLLHELRQDQRLAAVPVLALTAHAMRGDRERFLREGCDGYIPKPIQVSTFPAQVEQALVRGRRPSGRGEREE
jgi:two-component system cell cycle response regulator DivK